MKVLVIGKGGREHALVWKLKQSPLVREIFCAPGNGGISLDAPCVDIDPLDFEGLLRFCCDSRIDLVVVGPEAPLVEGIVDVFRKEKVRIFGPSQKASLLEGSKVFSKEMMKRWNVPTAEFKIFENYDEALSFVEQRSYPLVVKADGLCAGKGAFVCRTLQESHAALKILMLDKAFGNAGEKVVVEDFLEGEEVSILAVCDGKNFVCFSPSQDHKQVFDGDKGPNTGGMGAYSPVPLVSHQLLEDVKERILKRVIEGMHKDLCPFQGVLYAGLMITSQGPFVLEFNVRFGDPETQCILPRLKTDLAEIVVKSIDGNLYSVDMAWDSRVCICVVLASGGYPGKYRKGLEIRGLNKFKDSSSILVFHAGTKRQADKFLTAGGRVLDVVSLDRDFRSACQKVYRAVEGIDFQGMHYRRDIGMKALSKEEELL